MAITQNRKSTALSKYKVHNLPDVDRYTSDDYAINVALQETNKRFSIGVYITNYKVGVSGYQQYWHFDKDNRKKAEQVYNHINKIIKDISIEINEHEIPNVLIKPFIRNRLDSVGVEFKERSGIYNYNYYTTEIAKEEDWRSSIYGGRYPQHDIDQMRLNWHPDEIKSEIETKGISPRTMIYRYKYDQNNTNEEKMYSQGTTSQSNLQKYCDLHLPSHHSTIRIANDHLLKYSGRDIPLQLVEVLTKGEWIPMSHFAQNRNKMWPWAAGTAIGLMGLGLLTSPDVPDSDVINQNQTQTQTQNDEARGIRNNNPGNIERRNDSWHGMSSDQSADNRFVVFDYPQDGVRAMARILRNYQRLHNLRTIRELISRWAPGNENNTTAYINHISEKMGENPDVPINLSDDRILYSLISAIIWHENGYQPYDSRTIMEGIKAEHGSERPWSKTHDMPSKDIPTTLNQPEARSKEPPVPTIRPFDTKQIEIIDKKASCFHYAFQNINKVKARQLLYRAMNQVGINWRDITRVLIHEYNVPRELMGYLNSEFLQTISRMGRSAKWFQKLA